MQFLEVKFVLNPQSRVGFGQLEKEERLMQREGHIKQRHI